MPLNIKRLAFGDIVKFVVDGSAITNAEGSGGAGTSGPSVKPDGTTPADWKDFATVQKGAFSSVADDQPVWAPSPGAYRRVDVFRTNAAVDVKFTVQEVNELVVQSVLHTAALTTVSAQVGGKKGQIRGWLQISRAADNDQTVLLLELYGILTVKDLTADGKMVTPEVEFAVLHNQLNTVTPTLAAA